MELSELSQEQSKKTFGLYQFIVYRLSSICEYHQIMFKLRNNGKLKFLEDIAAKITEMIGNSKVKPEIYFDFLVNLLEYIENFKNNAKNETYIVLFTTVLEECMLLAGNISQLKPGDPVFHYYSGIQTEAWEFLSFSKINIKECIITKDLCGKFSIATSQICKIIL